MAIRAGTNHERTVCRVIRCVVHSPTYKSTVQREACLARTGDITPQY